MGIVEAMSTTPPPPPHTHPTQLWLAVKRDPLALVPQGGGGQDIRELTAPLRAPPPPHHPHGPHRTVHLVPERVLT